MLASGPGPASKKHVLLSEILAVTSTMRKNSRWASAAHSVTARDSALASSLGLRISSPAQSTYPRHRRTKEADLMFGFYELRRLIRNVDDIESVPLPTILAPFFSLIRSPLSTGPITSAALSSLHNFFASKVIHPQCLDLENALVELSSAVSHCKFEATDSSGDEVVLLKIITVIQDCMCGSVGRLLGDVEVCEMLETILTTCCQMRLSEALRRFSEFCMHSIVRTVFSRLYVLDPATEEHKIAYAPDEATEGEVRMNVTTDIAEPNNPPEGPLDPQAADLSIAAEVGSTIAESVEPPLPTGPRPEYGLPSIIELLRVLVNILNPNDQMHTDSTRLVSLGVLNAALEESGARLGDFPSLLALILDPGCKFLFQLARSENTAVPQNALRTIATLFETMRPRLKLQQELFLAFTIDRLAPPAPINNKALRVSAAPSPRPGSPATGGTATPSEAKTEEEGGAMPSRPLVAPARGETREILLETLSHIARHPSFMVDLYTNYDCDINCENLFERLIDFLTKGVYTVNSGSGTEMQPQNSQLICLDLLLSFVNSMASRVEGADEPWPSNFPPVSDLQSSKSRKKLVLSGASKFNQKPKTGLAFLEEKGLIYADLSPTVTRAQSLAKFLKDCTRLDKRLLGDYISKPDNIEVLKAFIGLFDFKDKPPAEAVRELLESFRLPGEAQQISRITETFAATYFASGPAEVKNEDAVYVLAYSIILLNTDLHNPQVTRRMSFEDYQKNLKGVNDGTNFSTEYLQEIYDSIRKREIVMPEEHTGALGFEYAWKELLARARQSGVYTICNASDFDKDMFKAVWKPIISAIAHAFITFDDDYVIQRSISGFRQCATLASRFDLPDVFDFIVVSLSQATSLLPTNLRAEVPSYPVVSVDGEFVTVSSLSVKFGTNVKGQLAAVVLFNIVNGNGNALREGWTQIFEMFENLFMHSLLPPKLLQMEDFQGSVTTIPLRPTRSARPAVRNEGGLLSALSSYLMTPYGASTDTLVPDATDSDIEETLSAIDCIKSCRLDELYSQITQLDTEALVAAVRALEALAHERTVAKLKQESDDVVQSNHPGNSSEPSSYSLPYDPASVFLLEMMVNIAFQAPQQIEEIWPVVFEHLSALLSSSTQYSVLQIERAVVCLLRLCLILAQKPSLRDQIYVSFDLLSGLPPSVANSTGEQVASGVVLLLQKHRDVIRSTTEWSLVFALLRSTVSHPEAARLTFQLLVSMVSDGPEQQVVPDNFSGMVTLLDDFASAAGHAVETHQAQGRRKEPLTAANSPLVERGRKAIDLLLELKKFAVSFVESAGQSKDQAWRQHFLSLLSSLGRQSTNAAREVRHNAISHLQRILLGSRLFVEHDGPGQEALVQEIFGRILFPLMDELLKPAVFARDMAGMGETRLRATALLCKAFMHFEVRERPTPVDVRILWVQILDLLDRYMNVDRRGQLYEAVPESLKNVVLVMNATDMLVPPPPTGDAATVYQRSELQRSLWTATEERIERFLPGFLAEIIAVPLPGPPPPPLPSVPPTPIVGSIQENGQQAQSVQGV